MANVNFSLKSENPNKKGEVHVIITFTHDGWRFRQNLFLIKPGHWSKTKQKVNPGRQTEPNNGHETKNAILENIRRRSLDYVALRMSEGKATSKSDFSQYINAREKEALTFVEFWEKFLVDSKYERKESTIKGYRTTLRKALAEFSKKKKYPLTFDSINEKFVSELRAYFAELGQTHNTLAKVLRQVRAVYGEAIKNEYAPVKQLTFLRVNEKVQSVIFLTKDELIKLRDCAFENKTYELVQDLFLFLCYTGIRVSEIRFHSSSIDYKNHVLEYRPEKDNSKPVQCFLIDKAVEILRKYEGSHYKYALPPISDQKFNEHLKECCRIAEIKTPVTVEKLKADGTIEKTTLPKHKVISTHMGRKTFNTLISPVLTASEQVLASRHKNPEVLRNHYQGVENEAIVQKVNSVFD